MKKLITLSVALLIATLTFGQSQGHDGILLKEAAGLKMPAPVQKHSINNSKAAYRSFWFNYPDLLTADLRLLGDVGALQRELLPVCYDSTAFVKYATDVEGVYQYSPVQFFGLGQVFAFDDAFWGRGNIEAIANYYSEQEGEVVQLPDMTYTDTYDLDSVSLGFYYFRGTTEAVSVVDTVIFSVIYDLNASNMDYVTTARYTVPTLNYNIETSQFDPLPVGSQIITYKHPLAVGDTSLSDAQYMYTKTVTFPLGLTNVTEKRVFVFYTFKPGTDTHISPNPVMGEEIGRFQVRTYKEPRQAYLNANWGTPELLTQQSTSMCAMAWIYEAGDPRYYHKMINNAHWNDHFRPDMDLLVTCNSCAMTSIEEMEAKGGSMTISPNPASNNFTVTLSDNGKSQIELYNLVGQKVYSTATDAASATVNVSNMRSGVYMLKVTQNGKSYTSKVVVK